jgi:hypothetical protein
MYTESILEVLFFFLCRNPEGNLGVTWDRVVRQFTTLCFQAYSLFSLFVTK